MSDYNFLKSGSGNNINRSEEELLKLQSLVMLFAENATKSAATYVEHSGRTILQLRDIQSCMKVEAMIFCKKDIINQANELLIDVLQNEEEYSNDDISDLITDEEEVYTKSKCTCELCQVVNHVDSFWTKWEPETPIELSLKKNLDKF